jgi:hypothetical protein
MNGVRTGTMKIGQYISIVAIVTRLRASPRHGGAVRFYIKREKREFSL